MQTDLGSIVEISLSDILSKLFDAGELASEVLRSSSKESRTMKFRTHIDDSIARKGQFSILVALSRSSESTRDLPDIGTRKFGSLGENWKKVGEKEMVGQIVHGEVRIESFVSKTESVDSLAGDSSKLSSSSIILCSDRPEKRNETNDVKSR